MDRRRVEARVAALMRRQHGVAAVRQMVAIGLPNGTVTSRIAAGRYASPWPGVVREAASVVSWEAAVMSAVLHVGGDAVVSHLTAAHLHGILPARPDGPLHLLVHDRVLRNAPALRVHRTIALPPADRTTVGSIPVTAVARTIADAASLLDADRIRELVAAAVRSGLVDATGLRAHLAARGRIRGRRALAAVLEELSPLDARCRNAFETRFLRVTTAAGIPPTAMNHPVVDAFGDRRYLDAAYLPHRLPIELDSARWHGSELDHADDLGRERAIVLDATWRAPLRFSWHEVHERPGVVVDTIRRALSVLGSASSPTDVGRGPVE